MALLLFSPLIDNVSGAASLPAPMAQQPVQAAVPASATFQSRLAEMNARPVLLDKIIGIKEVLSTVSATTPQADKDSMLAACNNLFSQLGTMKKNELTALKDLFSLVLANTFLLAPAQRPFTEQMANLTSNVQALADDNQNLVAALKNKIAGDKQDFMLALKAALNAMNLFQVRLSPEEYSPSNPNSLVSILREKIPVWYNSRAHKKIEELKLFDGVLNAALARKEIASVVGKTWENIIILDIALVGAQGQPNVFSQLTALQGIAILINAQTDRYERGLFVDLLTNIFAHRSERAPKEIDLMKAIIAGLTSADAKKNRVFDSGDMARFETWNKILDAYTALRALDTINSLDQKIISLAALLPTVMLAGADYEKSLFVMAFLNLFIKRTELVNSKSDVIKNFLLAVKNAPGFLTPTQMPMLTQWLEEVGK